MNARPRQAAVPAPFAVHYAAHTTLDEHTLATVAFAAAPSSASAPGQVGVGLAPLNPEHAIEVWTSPRPVTRGHAEGIDYSCNDEVLFGQLLIRESEHPSLDTAAFEGYRRILAFQRHMGYRHALRMWNFFPGINDGAADAERYKQFSLGRAKTYDEFANFERALPAASAIGSYQPGLIVYFIAAREPGVQIENPRQVPAFRYPRQYGPRPPSFSRAQLKDWGSELHLYISGTASVVGHESLHLDSAAEQVAEIARNVDALLLQAALADARLQGATARDLSLLRIYVRPPLGLDDVQSAVLQHFGPVPALYLAGDICRQELLVEIEGLYRLAV